MKRLFALGLLVLLNTASRAGAEEAAASRAKLLADRGVREAKQGDYAAAVVDFKAAYALVGKPKLLFNTAQCEIQLGHKRQAAEAFDRYLTEAATDPSLPDSYLTTSREQLRKLAQELAKITFKLSPEEAALVVDGERLEGQTAYVARRQKHTWQATAPGHQAKSDTFEAPGQGALSVKVTLAAEPSPPAPKVADVPRYAPPVVLAPKETAPKPEPLRSDEPKKKNRIPAYVAWGTSALAVGGVVFFSAAARDQAGKVGHPCESDADNATPECKDYNLKVRATFVSVGVAAVAATAGLILFLAAPASGGG